MASLLMKQFCGKLFDLNRNVLILMFFLVMVLSFAFYSYLYAFCEALVKHIQSSNSIQPSNTLLSTVIDRNYPPIVPKKTILLWTPFFGKKDYVKFSDYYCDVSNCLFSSNRDLLNVSDAVVFHMRDVNLKDLPSLRTPDQRWVLLHHEAPPHSPKDTVIGLDHLINWTITYRLDSDIVLTSKLVPKVESVQIQANSIDYAANKTRMVAWFVSNCRTPSRREDYVNELRRTVTVDIYGDCGEHRCVQKMSPKCYNDAARDYRFYLSFENSLCKDYVTEKFFAPMRYNIVPIVFGGANYSLFAPSGSYINADLFSSPRALGNYLIQLSKDKNRDKYNSYYDWKKKYEYVLDPYPCQLCKKLNDKLEPVKTWNNLDKWWFEDAQCKQWLSSTEPWLFRQ